ncbi:uncharacterized protein LOC121735683 [Aricia agestis]|uniref:uncharacterized protein LOC121735683 n=1 Tax=Aricia agestis TaxID=91739 RepID=UPI001C20859F|nr:uncharacterized protein LOC121735683 [Aricia agestis]
MMGNVLSHTRKLLSGSVPWDIDAEALADVYWRCAAVRAGGSNPLPDVVRRWRAEASERSLDLWAERLQEPLMLTGHGCFGRYLCQIARREWEERDSGDTKCHHCLNEMDTAEHTLSTCPSWTEQRAALTAAIEVDLSLPAIIRAMLSSEIAWQAVNDFAQDVITAKEEAERRREREAFDPLRRPRRRHAPRSGRSALP